MPQPGLHDQAKNRMKTINVALPAWQAAKLLRIAEESGVRAEHLATLAVATLIGGWDSGDAAWRDGVYKVRDLMAAD